MVFKKINSINESAKVYPWLHKPKHSKHLDEKQYKEIVNEFFVKLMYKLITTGFRVILPTKMGSLQFVKYNKKKTYVDFGEMKKREKLNKEYIILNKKNKITNGMWFLFLWSKTDKQNRETNATFKYKNNYYMHITRPNLRPNSYNKKNPKVSAIPYFKEHGWVKWAKATDLYLKIQEEYEYRKHFEKFY